MRRWRLGADRRSPSCVTAASVAAALELGEAVAAGPDPFDAQTPFYTPEGEARTLWRVWPQTPLEADRRYTLQVGDGLVSALGAERGLAEDPGFAVHTFPPPRYLGIQCTVGDGARLFAPDEPVHGCEPLDGIALLFNVPPDVDALRERLQLMPPPLQTEDAALDPWAVYDETPPLAGNHSPGQVYPLRLPFALAAETEYSLRVDGGLRDRFERPLAAAIDVTVATGVPSPRLVVERRRDTAGDFGRAGN
jgi:alpha-2-macroglobulin